MYVAAALSVPAPALTVLAPATASALLPLLLLLPPAPAVPAVAAPLLLLLLPLLLLPLLLLPLLPTMMYVRLLTPHATTVSSNSQYDTRCSNNKFATIYVAIYRTAAR